jgi:hypothetical protein
MGEGQDEGESIIKASCFGNGVLYLSSSFVYYSKAYTTPSLFNFSPTRGEKNGRI